MASIVACQYCRQATPCTCADPDGPTTRADFAEALANNVYAARRCIPRVGTPELPTKWDRMHALIDENLTLWELAE